MKNLYPNKNMIFPKCFIIDAQNKTLGRITTEIVTLLLGKYTTYYTKSINQGNFIIILNSDKIKITGNKELLKYYYKVNQHPNGLKKENFKSLNKRFPEKILMKSIWSMLPKNKLRNKYYKKLYFLKTNNFSIKF